MLPSARSVVLTSTIALVLAGAAPGLASGVLSTGDSPASGVVPGHAHLAALLDARIEDLEARGDSELADRSRIQRAQLDLVDAIDEDLDDTQAISRAINAARSALSHRAALDQGSIPAALAAGIAQQEASLDLVETLIARQDTTQSATDRLLGTLALVTDLQAATLAIPLDEPDPAHEDARPSHAIQALLAHHGVQPTTDQAETIAAYDALPAPMASNLAELVTRFLELEQAAHDARAAGALDIDPSQGPVDPATAEHLSRLLTARLAFAGAAVDLRAGLAQSANAQAITPVSVPPVLSIDLDPGTDHTYTEDVALLIDGGGSDTYLNNAGGSGFDILGDPCAPVAVHAAAALIDLGTGDDAYGDAAAPRSCGANGAGDDGVGFLLDEGGDDIYVAGRLTTNGGANVGIGALLDGGGSDRYEAGDFSSNGGGRRGLALLVDQGSAPDTYQAGRGPANGGGEQGAGFLLDEGGKDVYNATDLAVNGGSSSGFGMLVDLGWADDRYMGGDDGVNGGSTSSVLGVVGGRGGALLYDGGGNDTYNATGNSNNGAAAFTTVALLLDEGGHDVYNATEDSINGGATTAALSVLVDVDGDDAYIGTDEGVNGGGDTEGTGHLVDGAGNDTYVGTRESVNGGSESGVGFLYDRGIGADTYVGTEEGINGGGHRGVGFLYDAGGDDRYEATQEGVNGGVHLGGVGLLYDASGDDAYAAGDIGANGGTSSGAYGILYDAGGQDTYVAGACGVNGGGPAVDCELVAGVEASAGSGLLFDGAGTGDTYLDAGTDCTDCTFVPKGVAGAQIDRAG